MRRFQIVRLIIWMVLAVLARCPFRAIRNRLGMFLTHAPHFPFYFLEISGTPKSSVYLNQERPILLDGPQDFRRLEQEPRRSNLARFSVSL